MNGYYSGMVKVIGVDLMCFPAHPETLEPRSCGCYDPYAWSDTDPGPVETISVGEWNDRRNAMWRNVYHKARTDTMKAYRHLPLIGVEDLFSVIPYDCVPVAVDLLEREK